MRSSKEAQQPHSTHSPLYTTHLSPLTSHHSLPLPPSRRVPEQVLRPRHVPQRDVHVPSGLLRRGLLSARLSEPLLIARHLQRGRVRVLRGVDGRGLPVQGVRQ